ncbi:hypothetical protein P154DRAFT_82954 [Amniculicola lignicola CBS 123094]|uniref:Uncharacterized protein n=1 Tax=Amniculicola lignicola CBS 123094 TaxID=1392246 RepID=A0A6A5VV10_9PLEO|nr:hypothetical protein P154DRAFT_82954 [Amniculicola lignicola CBS 123094]
MLEAQAHLPLQDNQEACDGDNDYSNNDEDGNGDDDDAGSGWDDDARLQCPYPACNRKRVFNTRQGLVRHFQLHVQCYEMCVFCRDSFHRIRPFLMHQCGAKMRADDKAKEFYMKERCAQLQRYATETLRRMLSREDTNHERVGKRGHEGVDECLEHQSSKVHMATADSNADQWFPVEDTSPGVPFQSNARSFMQPALLSNGPATPASSFFNAGLSMQFPCSQTMERPANYTLGYAPIFEDITITPCYDLPQLFPSSTLNRDYSAIGPFESPDHSLEARAPEHQGGYGQTNGGTGAIPY